LELSGLSNIIKKERGLTSCKEVEKRNLEGLNKVVIGK
jgi:hypothetical protein